LEVDGRRLGDGGLRAVLPLGPAQAIPADLVVAVNVGPGFDEAPVPSFQRSNVPALVRAHGEAIRVMMADQAERAVADWPKNGPRLVYVRAVNEREATFAVDRLQDYVEAGYQATKKALA
jgi:predicted acylesterase/phospholipase RssA